VKRKLVYLYIALSVLAFIVRSIIFVSEYGGIEHDSGWYLGVAKNFAQRGIYASYTNTVIQEGKGVQTSIHGRFSVQDENGFSYFPAGVTAGPGYIIPEALMMKFFGYDFWQYRLWPLISYAGLLFIVFLIAYKIGGVLSLIILQLWLWVVPQLFIQFSYESYGEHTALFYLLLSFYTFYLFHTSKKKKYILIALSGLFFSLSVLTKYLFVLSGAGFGIIALWQLVRQLNKKEVIKSWGLWFVFFIIPIAFFEFYRYLFLLMNFGKEAWIATTEDFILHFKSNGGAFDIKNIDWTFVTNKAAFWEAAGVKAGFIWLSLPVLSYFYLKQIREKSYIVVLLFSAFFFTSLWFIFVSPFGWTRHVWHGLIIGMMLFVVFIVNILKTKFLKLLFIPLFLIALFGGNLLDSSKFEGALFLNQGNIDEWQARKYENGRQGLPSNPIVSLKDQIGLRDYFVKNVKGGDRVYYLGWLLVSEASPIVDKVFYSLDRYLEVGQINPVGGESYLIIGPYQKGKLSIVSPNYHDLKVRQLCEVVVYENPSYTLCILRNNLRHENKAYE